MSRLPIDDLPINASLPQILKGLAESGTVVLKAPPGAGKTTAVPPAIDASGIVGPGQIVLVQPRRLAARAAASRLAHLTETTVGQRVGYHVRFDHKASAQTRLLVVTTGILLRRLQSDPLLEDVACVILDEFHERSLEVDLALGMLQRIRTTLRPELKLVVMSATLDPHPIVEFLGEAVSVISEGRSYPVDVRYHGEISRQRIEHRVAAAVPGVLDETGGHLLVFLPGVGEIRRTGAAIASVVSADIDVLELYGDLPPRKQDDVLRESGRRKIILATNVAETSVTIPGVTAVIDSGQARVMRFDASVGLPKLQLEPISQASAQQRAGRAGRTEPGLCLRLWPANTHRARRQRDAAEIERADFSSAALMLFAWGERDVDSFPWLTPPPPDAVTQATELLRLLDATDPDRSLTARGSQMVQLPIHPRVARFLIEAEDRGILDKASLAAALLTERDPFRRPSAGAPRQRQAGVASDLMDKAQRLAVHLAGDRTVDIDRDAAKQLGRVAEQLSRQARKVAQRQDARVATRDPNREDVALAQALLAAYPDRVAKRRDDTDRGLMVGRRGVRLDRRCQLGDCDLFLCVDVDAAGSEATVRSATAVERDWLDPRLMRIEDEYEFLPSSEAVVARRREYFLDLPLGEHPISCQPSPAVAELLASAARQGEGRFDPFDEPTVSGFVRRVNFLCEQMPSLELPPIDDGMIDSVLVQLCQTRTSLGQLRKAPWIDHLRGVYNYQQLQAIDQHAPAKIRVPSGNSFTIHYHEGKTPYVQVRIQELFGWKSNPRIAGGNVPLCLHLLGPNHRPQQITEDLENFWSDTYLHVKKELKRRYPKHHWPDDPASAVATRNALKPRR